MARIKLPLPMPALGRKKRLTTNTRGPDGRDRISITTGPEGRDYRFWCSDFSLRMITKVSDIVDGVYEVLE